MKNLDDYDNAFSRYSKTLDNRSLPLHFWDFFTSHFKQLKMAISDASQLDNLAQKNNWTAKWNFAQKLEEHVVVVTDTSLSIVFASQNSINMTGYSAEEIIGRTPKMFQGEKTSKNTLLEIREAVNEGRPFEKTIVNYKKNGETYDCHIQAFPVFDKNKKLTNFIAFEKAA